MRKIIIVPDKYLISREVIIYHLFELSILVVDLSHHLLCPESNEFGEEEGCGVTLGILAVQLLSLYLIICQKSLETRFNQHKKRMQTHFPSLLLLQLLLSNLHLRLFLPPHSQLQAIAILSSNLTLLHHLHPSDPLAIYSLCRRLWLVDLLLLALLGTLPSLVMTLCLYTLANLTVYNTLTFLSSVEKRQAFLTAVLSKYLTLFQSLDTPLLMLDNQQKITHPNRKAASLMQQFTKNGKVVRLENVF